MFYSIWAIIAAYLISKMMSKHLHFFTVFSDLNLFIIILPYFFTQFWKTCYSCTITAFSVSKFVYFVEKCEYFLKLGYLVGQQRRQTPVCQQSMRSVLTYSARGQVSSPSEWTKAETVWRCQHSLPCICKECGIDMPLLRQTIHRCTKMWLFIISFPSAEQRFSCRGARQMGD